MTTILYANDKPMYTITPTSRLVLRDDGLYDIAEEEEPAANACAECVGGCLYDTKPDDPCRFAAADVKLAAAPRRPALAALGWWGAINFERSKMSKQSIKWEKNAHAPIPDYNSADGRWRIFKSTPRRCWCLQDRHDPIHPEPIYFTYSLADTKAEAISRLERSKHNAKNL